MLQMQASNHRYMTNTDSTITGITAWLRERLPEDLTAAEPQVSVDREEITVLLTVAAPETGPDATEAEKAEAAAGRVARFREQTRERRMAIAREAEHRFSRKVSWGVLTGERRELFTHLAVPVMTRLRQPQRQVLDTLVDAGVARSRADALAWCVRLVGENAEAWLGDLRAAMQSVEKVRQAGPGGQAQLGDVE